MLQSTKNTIEICILIRSFDTILLLFSPQLVHHSFIFLFFYLFESFSHFLYQVWESTESMIFKWMAKPECVWLLGSVDPMCIMFDGQYMYTTSYFCSICCRRRIDYLVLVYVSPTHGYLCWYTILAVNKRYFICINSMAFHLLVGNWKMPFLTFILVEGNQNFHGDKRNYFNN